MRSAVFFALALTASPALAAPHYHAQPVAKPKQAKLVVQDIVWSCGDSGCSAGKGNSRPQVMCASLARKVGTLGSFSVAGEALSSQELEKCNASAG